MPNQTLQWTGPASGVLVKWKSSGAVPAIERRSVIPSNYIVRSLFIHLYDP